MGNSLEDQQPPKRCYHLLGKSVVPAENHHRSAGRAAGFLLNRAVKGVIDSAVGGRCMGVLAVRKGARPVRLAPAS